MIVKTIRVLCLAMAAGAVATAPLVVTSTPLHAAISADEQAVLNVVVSAETASGPDAQVAALMASSLSGPQKALAIQWLIEGAATDAQAGALAAAVIAAAAAAAAAGQPGVVSILGTGLGQAYKALVGDGRASAASQVMAAVQNAAAEQGSAGGMSRQMAALFVSAFNSAAAGTPRGGADSSGEDTPDPGQTDTDSPTPSPS